MATDLHILTEAEHAEPFATVTAYFKASAAMAAAERRENHARSDTARAAARAERHAAWLVLTDCNRVFKQDNRAAHDAWRAEHGRAW